VQQTLKEDPHQIDSPNVTIATFAARSLRMLIARAENTARMILNLPATTRRLVLPLALALFVLIVIGLADSLFRQGQLMDFYVLAYMGMLVVYPYDEGRRYLLPVHPFLALYAFSGLEIAMRMLQAMVPVPALRSARAVAGVVTIVWLGILLTGLAEVRALAAANVSPDTSAFTNATTVEVARWVSANTRTDDVLMDDQEAILHRLTGRRTFRFPLSTDPAFLKDRVLGNGVDYIVVMNEKPYEYYNPSTVRRFGRLREENPALFEPVHHFASGTIYRVLPRAGR
jgi:hypothetical protein